ncbi:hypothetical protein NEOLI_005508, partial [Neolecta irregularis DAH-3]
HGFRASWENDALSRTGIIGDPQLSFYGVAQANQLAEHLDKYRIDRIYSSPFFRCVQTINYLADRKNLEICIENGISEWYITSQDEHPSPPKAKTLKTFFPRIKENYQPTLIPALNGESMLQLHRRAEIVVKKLIQQIDEEGDINSIVLCTHAATNISLGRALTAISDLEVRTGCASLGVYERQGDTDLWDCVRNGDCDFLMNGEERNWWFDEDGAVHKVGKPKI